MKTRALAPLYAAGLYVAKDIDAILTVFAVAPDSADLMILISGITLAFTQFLAGFEPIREEPRWEYVYPELALGNIEPEDKTKK
jgi:hypothetical protein